MPFLRRRTNMGSESDMRRHTGLFDGNGLTVPKPPPSRSGSTSDLLTTLPENAPAPMPGPPPPAPKQSTDAASAAAAAADARPRTPSINGRPSIAFSNASTSTAGDDRPITPPIQEATAKTRRFSMLRFRNASDSQLAAKAKMQAAAEKPPPLPRPPEIITTAPTLEFNAPQKKPSRLNLAARMRKSNELARHDPSEDRLHRPSMSKLDRRKSMVASTSPSKSLGVTFEEPLRPPLPTNGSAPPAYGEENGHALALPINRTSESSRSDGSSGDRVYGSTTTTTHTVSTTTTFFRLRRRPRQPEPLFPVAHLQKGTNAVGGDANASTSSISAPTPDTVKRSPSKAGKWGQNQNQTTPTPSRPSTGHGQAGSPAQSPALAIFAKANPSPATALFRPNSRSSGQSSPTRTGLRIRGRSSTMSSLGRNSPRVSTDEQAMPANAGASGSGGRKSFGDLLGLRGMRQNSEMSGGRHGSLTPGTPAGSNTSKNNSLQITRGSVILPERQEDDTPSKYLEKLLGVLSRSVIAAALSKGTDTFSQSVLRSYMRGFMFFEDPMDMAIRKLLMEAELPKETQQIDRCLQAFANRYHECNPGIYSSPDQAYFIAFSLLILHTDVFNKNNKHKMQKADYLKNTRGEGIFDEILEVFYDNITYTPFIHVEDDLDINGERIITHKAKKKSIFPTATPDPAKRVAKEPIDPYTLIIDKKLDILRPNLKDVMNMEDHYSYLGTAKGLNLRELQKTFFRTGVLQIVSARSRPDAFMSERTATNPEEAHPGIVDIKITKVGLLWRKDIKKKKTRSPWQEWGAILTGAQLYFFRNTPWVKNLMHQYDEHVKRGHDGDPCYFKPPLEHFKPDALMSTDGAVALLDSTYKKHKHAFTYVRHGGLEEVLLAENEAEMNDWLAKLNYAAAFRSSGVRMRGVVGGAYDGQGRRAIRRLDGDNTQSIPTPTGDVMVTRSRVDHKMAQDILAARRDIMFQKVADANEKIGESEKSLESQLRNARHLSLLAPIQPKTREQMLMSAARMAAQLKWTRMEIWRLKCHRDILLMDLEEERQQLGLPKPLETSHPALATPERPSAKEEGRATDASPPPVLPQKSPKSPVRLSLTRSSTATVRSDEDSPVTEVFQTPPTSATVSSFHKKQNSWELPNLNFDSVPGLRKASVSSAVSSNRSITATPPRVTSSSHSSPEKPPKTNKVDDENEEAEVDADERDLLEQAGLIEAEMGKPTSIGTSVGDAEEPTEKHRRRSQRLASGSTGSDKTDRADRKKVRRSLQRTLRESAGHLSHHRSRKGKEAATTPGGAISGSSEDPTTSRNGVGGSSEAAPDQLSRGSGSFVVHGKKASVITFGQELQIMAAPEERMRQRKASLVGLFREEAPVSPTTPTPAGGAAAAGGHTASLLVSAGAAAATVGAVAGAAGQQQHDAALSPPAPDFRAVLTAASQRPGDDEERERRESAASASTATARSFRELRRKYSQASKTHGVGSSGNLVVPMSDEDSDAAVSFSEGRHTPLPPTGEEDEVDGHGHGLENGTEDGLETGDDDDEDGDEDEDEEDIGTEDGSEFSPPPSRREEMPRESFFTPEPPMSPPADAGLSVGGEEVHGKGKGKEVEGDGGERLSSPPLQSVSA